MRSFLPIQCSLYSGAMADDLVFVLQLVSHLVTDFLKHRLQVFALHEPRKD
jgi:hypothetical protein